MPFTFLDHTGDIGVDLAAASLSALLEEAARAFTSTMCDPATVEARQTYSIEIAAATADLLLVDWLEELLYRFDVDRLLPRRAAVTLTSQAAPWRIAATLTGETVDPARHDVSVLIKGVTYHELNVTETPEGWRARVIFDI